MAEKLGEAVLVLNVEDKQFVAGLERAQLAAQRAGSGLQGALGQLGLATTIGGAAAFIGKQITDLDAAAAAVRTLGVDSNELVGRLKSLSAEFNNNISTVELTKAAYDVASSGFSNAADATSILRAASLGARGGFADVNDVASALTGVLNAYGLSADKAGLLTDQFIQTQADGVITVRQYAGEIGNIASIAAASGVGIEELNAAIATATLRGVPVSQTFTGLRQALSSIIKPSEQASELARSLGLQFNVGALRAKGLGGVLADVQQKTGGAADKIAILLGSVEAQAAVQPLLNDRLAKYNELLGKQQQAAGAAASASDTNSKTISGGLQQIGNGFANLATTLDTVLTPLLSGFIKDINSVLIKLNQVASLAPEKVLKRQKEAGDIVQNAIGPFGGSGFFGAVQVKYNGKTYKGSATGVREAIVQDLLNKDLAKLNAPVTSGATGKPMAAPGGDPAVNAAADLAAENDRLLKQSRQKLSDAQALQSLQGIALSAAKQQLEIDRLRTAEAKAVSEYDSALMSAGMNLKDSNVLEKSKAVQIAGNNLRAAVIEASDALRQSAQEAAKRLIDASQQLVNAQLKLSEVRANPQGLSRFLAPQDQQQRLQSAILQLGPALQSALKDARSIFNAQGVGLGFDPFQQIRQIFDNARTGTYIGQDSLQAITQFINDVNAERSAVRGVNDAQKSVNQINQELAAVNGSLRDQVYELVRKNWDVQVNVNGAAASIYGDAVNRSLS